MDQTKLTQICIILLKSKTQQQIPANSFAKKKRLPYGGLRNDKELDGGVRGVVERMCPRQSDGHEGFRRSETKIM